MREQSAGWAPPAYPSRDSGSDAPALPVPARPALRLQDPRPGPPPVEAASTSRSTSSRAGSPRWARRQTLPPRHLPAPARARPGHKSKRRSRQHRHFTRTLRPSHCQTPRRLPPRPTTSGNVMASKSRLESRAQTALTKSTASWTKLGPTRADKGKATLRRALLNQQGRCPAWLERRSRRRRRRPRRSPVWVVRQILPQPKTMRHRRFPCRRGQHFESFVLVTNQAFGRRFAVHDWSLRVSVHTIAYSWMEL